MVVANAEKCEFPAVVEAALLEAAARGSSSPTTPVEASPKLCYLHHSSALKPGPGQSPCLLTHNPSLQWASITHHLLTESS